ncbi:CHASE2 domain-containing protein [Aetokthonos hydrillicola Thurmond2011]|uniref:CHASE2 domain-containing protein n=1 Tax=Aetokthonos hydrillicola Thurmond2011 TaxID=2712845 RepID=A0AAP5I3P8_9CYAN|nr:CHASE2 domain-containing protein [Aetokthonos hydrillicola]MBO3462213.1 CHASE2 domain-containing protein [Aetokthonos hydrillicola CCALA 1050]MBW4585089.1 CHASE2 domain-containing protein [Aetokthonos hydrillicola CCALA 1050]MDR9894151.1 CHASE2 domain-containing protein [Aetokthonos hydrillicola Thurmond2011]
MSKLVIFNLGRGTLQEGFPFVTVQLFWDQPSKNHLQQESHPKRSQFQGSLPAATEIYNLYCRWQLLYDLLYEARSINIGLRQQQQHDDDIEIDEVDVTHVSDAEFYQICDQLQNQIDNWLDYDDFRHIDRQLRVQLAPDDEIRVIIQTEDNFLRKLPWHIWRFFRDYPQAEVALSAIEFEPGIQTKNSAPQVRILAILGDSTGIDVDADRRLLSRLPDAKTVFLVEPKRQQLDELLWHKQGWDILFFAGHSSTTLNVAGEDGDITETGYLYINPTERLTVTQLKNALKKAIDGGLQLAIFNSCDGLGLAQQLQDLHIPQIIVMRFPVPDRVAQEFLKHFLKEFARGKPLYLAVREAREKLQGLESDFPGASWLPVICQNPAEMSPTWKVLRDKIKEEHQRPSVPQRSRKLNFTAVLILSFLVTSLLMGVRWLGILQGWELQAFDHLLQQRPLEKQDNRILIVTITEEDFQLKEQQHRVGSLSDLALAQLLEKLEYYQPRAIGLDIYRYFPVNSKYLDLASRLRESDRFFAICEARESDEKPGIAPPPEIPIERQGFSDFAVDPGRVLRRHLIALQPSSISPCTTPYALSARLAFHYLESFGISVKYTQQGDLQVGKVVFPQLRAHTGGYQKIDDRGYQILLNYRSSPSPREVAERVSLKDVLTDKVNPDAIKNRIILIGVTTSSAGDDFFTPYNSEMSGVIFHAQMVSQIISTVLDGRPLLWVLPFWGEFFWVFGWSCVGGIIAWRFRKILPCGLAFGFAILGLYGVSYCLLIQGCWVALVPSALALVVTGGSVRIIRNW